MAFKVYYDKGLVINYGVGGGASKWENRGSETFSPSLTFHRGKTSLAPPSNIIPPFTFTMIRDWSLIMGWGEGLQNRKIADLKLSLPP